MNAQEMLEQMGANQCHFCKQPKDIGCMFCNGCWQRLPEYVQQQIDRALNTVSAAFRLAWEVLEIKK